MGAIPIHPDPLNPRGSHPQLLCDGQISTPSPQLCRIAFGGAEAWVTLRPPLPPPPGTHPEHNHGSHALCFKASVRNQTWMKRVSRSEQISIQLSPCFILIPSLIFPQEHASKMCVFIYTMEYYSSIRRKDILPFVMTWMDLEALC